MNAALFIVSFERDLEYTVLCCRSVARFVTGFRRVVLVVPTVDRALFEALAAETVTADGVKMELRHHWEVRERGHFSHEFTKCGADLYCRGVEWIVHLDADSIYTRAVTPADYFRGGRAILLVTPFAKAGDARAWKPGVDHALGGDAPYECMQWPQLVHHRDTYRIMREHVEARHACPFWHYVMTERMQGDGVTPMAFSEYVTLGAWALAYEPLRRHYCVVEKETAAGAALPRFVEQGWSHFRGDRVRFVRELCRFHEMTR